MEKCLLGSAVVIGVIITIWRRVNTFFVQEFYISLFILASMVSSNSGEELVLFLEGENLNSFIADSFIKVKLFNLITNNILHLYRNKIM